MITENNTIPFSQFIKNDSKSALPKVGWLCTYTPEEIIIANGFWPVRITGKEKAKKAEGYFPINFCPFIKSSMEDLMALRYELSAVIVTNSCDGMRRFYDIASKYIPDLPFFMLDVPRNQNKLAVEYFAKNILKMSGFLETIRGRKMLLPELTSAQEICSEKRIHLKKLSNFFRNDQKAIGIKNYFNILISSMTEEPGGFNTDLKSYLEYAEIQIERNQIKPLIEFGDKSIMQNPEVMIIGNFIDEDRLWEIFDELGCKISADDLCTSSRYFENIIQSDNFSYIFGRKSELPDKEISADILIRDIAVRQLFKPQCMRMANLNDKLEEINKNIVKNKIKGIIYISQKFCDTALLFYPLLREKLNEENIPSLFIEIEHNNLSVGQIKTRIQAFLEIV
jgi:benzoyl-CoA reductase/2-hydroxyglutaryl-CoA dehydratase subunit BcrC/BadD/HgdB